LSQFLQKINVETIPSFLQNLHNKISNFQIEILKALKSFN